MFALVEALAEEYKEQIETDREVAGGVFAKSAARLLQGTGVSEGTSLLETLEVQFNERLCKNIDRLEARLSTSSSIKEINGSSSRSPIFWEVHIISEGDSKEGETNNKPHNSGPKQLSGHVMMLVTEKDEGRADNAGDYEAELKAIESYRASRRLSYKAVIMNSECSGIKAGEEARTKWQEEFDEGWVRVAHDFFKC